MHNEMLYIRLHHGSLIVNDLQKAIFFYCHILGIEQDHQRPEMSFKGAWLNIGEQQIHLLVLPRTEKIINQPEHAGRDRHLALHVRQIETIKKRLTAHQIPFTMSHSGRQALFCRDPDGNGLEFIVISPN